MLASQTEAGQLLAIYSMTSTNGNEGSVNWVMPDGTICFHYNPRPESEIIVLNTWSEGDVSRRCHNGASELARSF